MVYSVDLKAETEGFIMAAQDQSLYTRSYQARIIKNEVDTKCKMYDQYDETVDHLVSGSHVIRPTEYKNRHESIGQYIHWKICQQYKAPYHKNWYEHKLEKQRVLQSFGILQYIQIEKLMPINLILQLRS